LFTNKGKLYEKILVIGDHQYANHFHQVISQHSFYGFQCVGALYDHAEGFTNCPYLGTPAALSNIISESLIDEVVIALPKNREKEINEIIIICNNSGIKVRIIPDFMHFTSSPMTIENIGLIPVISQQSYPLEEWFNQLLKRSFDILFSLLFLIVIGSWLFPIIAILIKLSSKGPVFYKQTRWGLNNKHFKVYKFRTMVNQASTIDSDGKFMQTEKDDARVTTIGRLLRAQSLDELPQFINVLMGDMSIVGPRPHAIPQNIESLEEVSSYTLRHIIKPGITGWAQVNGCRGITKTHFDMQNRVNYDLYYIRKWNFWFDIQIILQTIFQLIKGNENVY
jgi:putative colanic acid biosynthesis UDP-glucose lipid carrier transferase